MNSSVHNRQEHRSIDCNFCTTVCSNYVAYKGHVWKNHTNQLQKQGNQMKQRPYDLDGRKGVTEQ